MEAMTNVDFLLGNPIEPEDPLDLATRRLREATDREITDWCVQLRSMDLRSARLEFGDCLYWKQIGVPDDHPMLVQMRQELGL